LSKELGVGLGVVVYHKNSHIPTAVCICVLCSIIYSFHLEVEDLLPFPLDMGRLVIASKAWEGEEKELLTLSPGSMGLSWIPAHLPREQEMRHST
jgi:hypothetical protein